MIFCLACEEQGGIFVCCVKGCAESEGQEPFWSLILPIYNIYSLEQLK